MDVLPRDIIFTILSHIGAADIVKFKGASRWCAAIAREYEISPQYCKFRNMPEETHKDDANRLPPDTRGILCAAHGHVRCFIASPRMQSLTQYHDVFAAAVDSRYMPMINYCIDARLYVSVADIDYIIKKGMLRLVASIMRSGKTTIDMQDVIHCAVYSNQGAYNDNVLFDIISSQPMLCPTNAMAVPTALINARRFDLLERVIAVHPINIDDKLKLRILYTASDNMLNSDEIMRAAKLIGVPRAYLPVPVFGLIERGHYDVVKLILRDTPAIELVRDLDTWRASVGDQSCGAIDFMVSLYGRGCVLRAAVKMAHAECAAHLVRAHGVKMDDVKLAAIDEYQCSVALPKRGYSEHAYGAYRICGVIPVDDNHSTKEYRLQYIAVTVDMFMRRVAEFY